MTTVVGQIAGTYESWQTYICIYNDCCKYIHGNDTSSNQRLISGKPVRGNKIKTKIDYTRNRTVSKLSGITHVPSSCACTVDKLHSLYACDLLKQLNDEVRIALTNLNSGSVIIRSECKTYIDLKWSNWSQHSHHGSYLQSFSCHNAQLRASCNYYCWTG